MIIRSKAPLRLGLAGGGTDVSPYSETYGGLILNATIDLYAYCTIEETNAQMIEIYSADLDQLATFPTPCNFLPLDGKLDLIKQVYNHLVSKKQIQIPPSFKLTTYSDAPPGSGLGSSSTMVVAVLKAFVEWLNLPFGEYEIANIAYVIERIDLGLSGGKQDQYAATFGGFNFMEFLKEDRIIVNPLRLKRWVVDELQASLILYDTGASRSSAKIIEEQRKNTFEDKPGVLDAIHSIKQSAIDMKEAILKGDMNSFASILGKGWSDKKKLAKSVSNKTIDDIYDSAMDAGAIAGKVSGAGGGGFMIFVVDPVRKNKVIGALQQYKGRVINFNFTEGGCHGWKIY